MLRVFHESKGNARDAAWSTSFSLIRKAEEADQDDDRVDSANQFENRISAVASLLKQSRNKAAERGGGRGRGRRRLLQPIGCGKQVFPNVDNVPKLPTPAAVHQQLRAN